MIGLLTISEKYRLSHFDSYLGSYLMQGPTYSTVTCTVNNEASVCIW